VLRKKIALAALAALFPIVALLAVDTYLHHRAAVNRSYAHVNRWGYRGPVVGSKQPGEYRIAMVGGSTAFGLGAELEESIPAVIERELRVRTQRRITVVNVAFPADGAYADRWTLNHYRFLDYDAAIIYSAYNDLRGEHQRNLANHRHESAIFKLTGYYPWVSVALKSKARELRGDPNGGEEKPVVGPGILRATGAATLDFLAALDRQLGLSAQSLQTVEQSNGGADPLWGFYLEQIDGMVSDLLANGKRAIVVIPPKLRSTPDGIGRPGELLHISQRAAVRRLIAERYAANPRVLLIDASETVDLLDRRYAFHDRIHLNAGGNAVVAAHIASHLSQSLN
jgi:hypothetical protein